MLSLIGFLLGVWITYLVALTIRAFVLKAWFERLLQEEVQWIEDHPQYIGKVQALGFLRIESLFARKLELYFKVWIDLKSLEEPVYNYYREDLP